ncbi:MAG: dissimilatory-type sulfite reductase subunit alpha [Gammaproteobacteria bacterium]|nr:dissimilatory-type sulfite reductase subunit alpha [Gammaproteobacteria bacterium]
MAKEMHATPLLDQLESGPWPSFVTGIKRLAQDNDMMVDLLGQLETSYRTRKGYWKGGTVGVVGYGGGVIPRFTELKDKNEKALYPSAAEFHTIRIQPTPGFHYTSDLLRKFSDVWEKHGSGLLCLHGQSGDLMLQGCTTAAVQPCFDEVNAMGFDMGGAGPALRTASSCVGHARCEHSCYDEYAAHRQMINAFLDDMHRPALPYKWKFKFSGCANDCSNATQRADEAVIGTWRDDMKVDQEKVKEYVSTKGRKYIIDNVITRCPTNALALNDDDTLDVDNKNCVRCMHCINVMTKALAPGDDKGVMILVGGKRTLKIGDTFGTVIVPFMKVDTEEGLDELEDLSGRMIDFFAENALEHERCGEMIDRIGLANYLEGIEVDIDPNQIDVPRTNPYVRMDGWDEEVAKWEERKA